MNKGDFLMRFFDTHIHLQDFDTDIFSVFEKIQKCVCVSAKISDWENVASLYEKYPKLIIPAFGLHPWYANNTTPDWDSKLELYLIKYPNALVGECGFDKLKSENKQIQEDAFIKQISLAKKYNRALIIHAVKATEWLDEIWNLLPDKFVFHSFNARTNLLKKVLDNGGYIALNKKILQNKQATEIINSISLDRILIESDAPYQSQVEDIFPFVERLAQVRKEKLEVLVEALYKNALELVKND